MKACVDIGGTKVAVTLARDEGGPQSLLDFTRCTEPTANTGAADALAQQVLRLISAAQAKALAQGWEPALAQIRACGVCACGPFLLIDGAVSLAAPNICGGIAGAARGLPNDWTQIPLETPLRQGLLHHQHPSIGPLPPDTPLHLRVENDAIAALEAERQWGALQGYANCAYVTWSTGIGAGLCVDGRVLRGKNGNAGHAGHQYVSDSSVQHLCGCGNHNDVESLAAGNALQRHADMDSARLMQLARSGDAAALARVDEACRVMGRALYNMVVLLDLQRISIGGSVFLHHPDLLLPRLRAQLDGHLPSLTTGVELVPAGLGPQVADFGALAMASTGGAI